MTQATDAGDSARKHGNAIDTTTVSKTMRISASPPALVGTDSSSGAVSAARGCACCGAWTNKASTRRISARNRDLSSKLIFFVHAKSTNLFAHRRINKHIRRGQATRQERCAATDEPARPDAHGNNAGCVGDDGSELNGPCTCGGRAGSGCRRYHCCCCRSCCHCCVC
jgi:hypothetical protein